MNRKLFSIGQDLHIPPLIRGVRGVKKSLFYRFNPLNPPYQGDFKRKCVSPVGFICLIALFLLPLFAHAQEKITGPWLWMIAPTEPGQGGAASIDIDSLAVASGGAVTEADVAANGAREGDKVGNYAWTLGQISAVIDSTGADNINDCLTRIGLTHGNVDDHSSYALFTFKSDTAKNSVPMSVGSSDAIKVWLNGEVVYNNSVFRGHLGFEDTFPINLVAGDNLLMVKVSDRSDWWNMFVGIDTVSSYVGIETVSGVSSDDGQIQDPDILRPIVYVVYRPLPGSPPRPNVDAEIDALIKETQRFFADEMERHGFGRKTFQIEVDTSGNTVVHREPIHNTRKGFFVYMDDDQTQGKCGLGSAGGRESGFASIYFSHGCWNWKVIAHELGHAFGLKHDFRIGSYNYIMSYGSKINPQLSHCAAEWLDVHSTFNPGRRTEDEPTKTEMLSPTLDSHPNAIRLHFKVTDPDGLHQVQLLTPSVTPGLAIGFFELISCKSLNGSTDTTVEFVTTDLTPTNKSVSLMAIDVHGNFTWHLEKFPINVTSLLPPPKVVSIPDPNLSAAIRKSLNIHQDEEVTTHLMWDLRTLSASGQNITELTGIEHGLNLRQLYLSRNSISDITHLRRLKKLTYLGLYGNRISDISPIVMLNLIGPGFDGLGLNLNHNPLSYNSVHVQIPILKENGIIVSYDNVTHPAILKISGDNQEAMAGTVLPSPLLVEAQDEKGNPISDLTVQFSIKNGGGQLTNATTKTDTNGRGQTYHLLGWHEGSNTVHVTADGIASSLFFTANATSLLAQTLEDVNRDGQVDVEDLVLVAASLGTTPPKDVIPNPDVNGDGVVNSGDLALVMAALENSAAAPAVAMTAENLQRWIDEAKQLANKDEIYLKGITALEQLLSTLLPKKTVLLANFPNPFNPETWIPFHLAKPSKVKIHIYGVDGTLVRTLSLGQKAAGKYEHQTHAAYWDGRNAQGEHVASGVYFYTFTADDFTSTRKMLIRK